MLSQHVHPSWSKNSSKALILDLFRILSRGNQKITGLPGNISVTTPFSLVWDFPKKISIVIFPSRVPVDHSIATADKLQSENGKTQ